MFVPFCRALHVRVGASRVWMESSLRVWIFVMSWEPDELITASNGKKNSPAYPSKTQHSSCANTHLVSCFPGCNAMQCSNLSKFRSRSINAVITFLHAYHSIACLE
jgi:hypothetical protein